MTEASLSDPLLAKYPGSFWPAVYTVRQNQASPCVCLSMVQFLPTGHILGYTDIDWQKKLVMLDQELQFSQSVPLQSGARKSKDDAHSCTVDESKDVSKKPPPNQGILFNQIEARTVESQYSFK